MKFKERAIKNGAFGYCSPPKDLRYYAIGGVGLGWHWSEPNQKPCLVGLYSEANPHEFRKGLRQVLRILWDVFEEQKYRQVLAALDYRHKCFPRLLKAYQKHAGFQVAGELNGCVVLVTDVERLVI
jgi:hypothetical protein